MRTAAIVGSAALVILGVVLFVLMRDGLWPEAPGVARLRRSAKGASVVLVVPLVVRECFDQRAHFVKYPDLFLEGQSINIVCEADIL